MQFSLRLAFAVVTYVAVCLVLYVNPSLWVGTLVVAATAALYALMAVEAYRLRRSSYLAFSVVGLCWMVFWLGLYFETTAPNGTPFSPWKLPQQMAELVSMGRSYEYDSEAQSQRVSDMHSIHFTAPVVVDPSSRPIPSYQNATRFFVCVTSLVAALVGGCCFRLIEARRTVSKGSQEQ